MNGKKQGAFHRFAIGVVGYNLLVILWGAYVRATGSGAGCGDHWPLCNGEVLPSTERIQTAIEFAHRISSGLSLLLVAFMFFWSRKIAAVGSQVRRATKLCLFAIILEALLGAGLVLLKLVEFDQSAARAISIALHLVNTSFLLGTLVLSVFVSRNEAGFLSQERFPFPRVRFFWGTVGLYLLLGASGAIAALGDTLFPANTLLEAITEEFKGSAHFLIQLRVFHPLLAILWVVFVFVWSKRLETRELFKVRATLISLLVLQFLIGFLNWVLMAPNFLQLIHLLVADLVWIALIASGLMYETRKSSL